MKRVLFFAFAMVASVSIAADSNEQASKQENVAQPFSLSRRFLTLLMLSVFV